MLQDISVRCEGEKIKIQWKWMREDLSRVEIFYKKKEIISGDGASFVAGGVNKIPHVEQGTAERMWQGERGLYTFLFRPITKAGNCDGQILLENIMLGEPVRISWSLQSARNGTVILFDTGGKTIPEKILLVSVDQLKFRLQVPIDTGSRLLLEKEISADKLYIYAEPPYDKAFQIHRK